MKKMGPNTLKKVGTQNRASRIGGKKKRKKKKKQWQRNIALWS